MELLDYQQRVFDFLKRGENRDAFVVHGIGCGKTTMACYIAKEFLRKKIVKGVLFVAPVSIHSQIKTTLSTMKAKLKKISTLSYHAFLHNVDATGKLIIVDEAHNLRTHFGKMATNCIKTCATAKKVLIMTATPFVNEISDLANLLSMCGHERLDEMNVFYKERPVSDDYPTFEVKQVSLDMDTCESESYGKCRKEKSENLPMDIIKMVGKLGQTFMTRANGMRRVGDAAVLAKLKYLENTIEEFEQQIVFSSWKKAGVYKTEPILKAKNIPYGIITGDTPKGLREQFIKGYNSSDIKVLLFSRAGGEGIDLKGTNRVVILEPGWNSMVEQQAMNRAIRYRSHAHLPSDKRHVVVEKLYINTVDKEDSTDLYLLRNYIEPKEEKCMEVMNLLKGLSLNLEE